LGNALEEPEGATGLVAVADGTVVYQIVQKAPPDMSGLAVGEHMIRTQIRGERIGDRERL